MVAILVMFTKYIKMEGIYIVVEGLMIQEKFSYQAQILTKDLLIFTIKLKHSY